MYLKWKYMFQIEDLHKILYILIICAFNINQNLLPILFYLVYLLNVLI